MKIEIKSWSIIGRFRDLINKMISLKFVVLIFASFALWFDKLEDTPWAIFASAVVGVNYLGKKLYKNGNGNEPKIN